MSLTAAEITFYTNNTASAHTDVAVIFSSLGTIPKQDIALASTTLGVMNRFGSEPLGGLFYRANTDYPSSLLQDIYNFISGDAARYIYPQHETNLIPRAPLSVFQQICVHLALWDAGTNTWEAALSEQDVKDELAKLFHYFGHSAESGWERMMKYESVLALEDEFVLSSSTAEFIPTGAEVGINLPTDGWSTTEDANMVKWDNRAFLVEAYRDARYLLSAVINQSSQNTHNLDDVGTALRNMQSYDIDNLREDRVMLTSGAYISTEVPFYNRQSFRQLAVEKAQEARGSVSW
jgi:hypothetical protein